MKQKKLKENFQHPTGFHMHFIFIYFIGYFPLIIYYLYPEISMNIGMNIYCRTILKIY